MSKKNYSVARVVTHTQSTIGKCERHNERKNESYANMNVDTDRCDMNVHFKSCGELTYNDQLNKLIAEKKVCMRGLKADAKVFDEMIFDVNTDYFETHGGYEYAKEFYEEAYRFAVNLYGEHNIISAVMHADELNVAITEQYGKPVYHYHMHLVALPVVEKQILWTKRCKDKSLVGTVKEMVNQISHSKKWRSPQALDENGNIIFNEKGKPVLIPSYSILQDDFFNHMQRAGFNDFIRGEKGSTAEHLSCLQYEIQQDNKRLEEIQERLQTEEIRYDEIQTVHKTFMEIEHMGKKTLTGKVTISSDDFNDLSNMAKQSVAARSKIYDLEQENRKLQNRIWDLQGRINRLSERLHELEQVCAPYLEALRLMPEKVKEECANENLAEVVIDIVVNDIKPFEDTKFLRDLDEEKFEFLVSYMFDNTIIQEELKKNIRESTRLKDKEIECIERLLNTLLDWIISKRLSKAYCFHNLSELFRFDNDKSNFIWNLFYLRKQELIAVVLLENIAVCRDIKEKVDGWTELFSNAFCDNEELDEDGEIQ